MNCKVYIMAHKAFPVPRVEGYVPLQVGSALHEDLGYLRDDSGDHISDLNPYFCELTGQYWLWRNVHDVDMLACCHYRRYFVDEEGKLLRTEAYEELLADADLLAAYVENGPVWRRLYSDAHQEKDLLETGKVIRELYPEYYPAFEQVLESSRVFICNMYAMRKSLFDEYCAWLFDILTELSGRIDISGYTPAEQRIYGFLAENLIQVYALTRNLRVVKGRAALTAEKVETKELKVAMKILLGEGKLREAQEMFRSVLAARPDLSLDASDLSGEIPEIAEILLSLEKEFADGRIPPSGWDLDRLLQERKALQ